MKLYPLYPAVFVSPITGRLASFEQLPELEIGQIWIGSRSKRALPSLKVIDLRIDVNFLLDKVDKLISSVGISVSRGLSVSGSPITESGTINLTLDNELQSLSALSSNGILVRTGAATYIPRTITANTGISITNPDGVSGNPTISVSNVGTAGTYAYPSSVTTNAQGQISSITAGDTPLTAIYGSDLQTQITIVSPNISAVGLTDNVYLLGTQFLRIPTGTTAQRPDGSLTATVAGMMRFNTTLGVSEQYDGSSWLPDTFGTVTSITAGAGLAGGTITSSGTISIANDTTLPGSGAVIIPRGTTAQRPSSPAIGMIRYNIDSSVYESYSGSSWLSQTFGTVTSVSGTSGQISSTGGNTPVLALISTGVGAGSYTNASITVDTYGRATAVSSGTPPILGVAGTTNQIYVTPATQYPVIYIAANPIIPGTDSITIPIGSTAQRSGTPTLGMFRANSDTNVLEYYGSSSWLTINSSNATVSSVAITGSTGLSVSGSPVTTSGTFGLTLGTELQGLSSLATTGIVARTGTGAYVNRTITASTGISVTNGNGVSDNPTIAVSIIPLANGGTNANLTASNGGIFYSTASAGAVLSGTSTANQILLSGSSTAPSWSTATYPVSTTINQLIYSSAANTIAGLSTANNGVLITSGSGIPSISTFLPTAVQANITSAGTLTSGTWNASLITVGYGGTGLSSTTAYGVLCGGTTSTSTYQNVGTGTSAQFLSGNGSSSLPTWKTAVTSVAISVNSGLTVSGSPITGSGTITLGLSNIPITALSGYPSNTTTFLRGDGTWSNTFTGGINITGGRLEVTSTSSSIPSGLWFAYFKLSGSSAISGGWNLGGLPVSIACSGSIWAVEFESTSSIKKKNILSKYQDFKEELKVKFDNIDFVKYEWKDKPKKGFGEYYGYIAENVSETFPELVNLESMDYSPSILKFAKVKNISLQSCDIIFNEDVNIAILSKIKYYTNNEKQYETIVLEQLNSRTYRISITKEIIITDEIFVYGVYEKVPLVSKTRFSDMVATRLKILIDDVSTLSQKIDILENKYISTLS